MSRLRLEGWLRCLAHPFSGVECRGVLNPPLALCSSEVAIYLLSRICPSCTRTQLLLVPYSFSASSAAKGPRSQPISG